jgi:PH (Pleckstrin Homology) domain-containing protein
VSAPRVPSRLVFRTPGIAVLAALLLALGATPFAVGQRGFALIYLVPLGLIVWVLRTRTTADRDGLAVRRVFTSRSLPWSSLKGLRLTKRAGVHAVLADDREVALPAVRTRHLSALALVSGGRLDDPLEVPQSADRPPPA